MEVSIMALITLFCCAFSTTLMMFPSSVSSDPIKIDFTPCQNATYSDPQQSLQCCPPLPTRPIIDGAPPPSTNYTRVRPALQCTDAAYAAKLEKGYALMRALPDDDPRSFKQQWTLHCSYCGGAFLTYNASGYPRGIDIHSSWLFFPWHRWHLYFHERILQSLLGDPTFSLNYWNWDAPYSVGDGSSKDGACLKQGQDFPAMYQNMSGSLYDLNRSQMAKGNRRLKFPDLTSTVTAPASHQPLYNASEQDVIASNMNVMYKSFVSGGTTSETFIGRVYRAGDIRDSGGAGSLENGPHAGVHAWTGQDPPYNLDMGLLSSAAHDPIFFAHHSNVDRLWEVWKSIGPVVGQNHSDYTDPDFLDAEFLFYDEKKDLRRVTVRESLDTIKLGFTYQESNIAPWLYPNYTICSQLTYAERITQAESLPAPKRDTDGYYQLQGGTLFTVIIDRPNNPYGLEEFLSVEGIRLDRSTNAGFNVFVNLLNPDAHNAPGKCAEYGGRFMNMARNHHLSDTSNDLVWKQSVTRTLVDINAEEAPSKIVITLQPLSHVQGNPEIIKFTGIKVDT